MFELSVKDLAGGLTILQTNSLPNAKTDLSAIYHKNKDCIILFDLTTGKELTEETISQDIECGICVNSYSKEDKELFERYSYPSADITIFYFDVYMDVRFKVESIERELFILIYKIPEFFEWIHDRSVQYLTFETYHNHHQWYQYIPIDDIFDTLVQCLSDNTTLIHANLNIFKSYLSSNPTQLEKLQHMLNHHPCLDSILLSRHDERNDKVIKLCKQV